MKKLFVVFVTLLVLSSLVLSVGAVNWENLTDKVIDTSYQPDIISNTKYNEISTNLKEYMYRDDFTAYIRVTLYADASFPLQNLEQYSKVKINEDALSDQEYYDVSGVLSFGLGGSIKPSAVYLQGIYTAGSILSIVPKDITEEDWYSNGWQYSGRYTVEQERYANRYVFCIKYEINPSYVVRNQGGPLAFYDNNNIIDLTPVLLGSPYIGDVSIRVRSIYTIAKSSPLYQYNGQTNNPYHVITSTNMFTPATQVPELYIGTQQLKKSANWQFTQQWAFSYLDNVLVGATQTIKTYYPYINNQQSSSQSAVYKDVAFSFGERDVSFYGVRFNGEGIAYGFVPLGSQANPTTNFFVGYKYQCNTNNYCSAIRFNITQYVSYKEDFSFVITPQDNQTINDVDISQFYKEVRVKFSTDEGILQGLSNFFASLFTETLPNIINNFIVWFMCESPLLSVVTKPLFLIFQVTVGYAITWIVPLLSAMGVFGGIVFVIFIIKKIVPALIGGCGGD